MSGHDYMVELEEAQEILDSLRKAYKEYAASRGVTERYKIKDREMEFSSLADSLKRIRFWQWKITQLEMAAGIPPRHSDCIITQF